MNGKPLDKDLSEVLGREVRIQNDANCMAVSEAIDGLVRAAAWFTDYHWHGLRLWHCNQWPSSQGRQWHWW